MIKIFYQKKIQLLLIVVLTALAYSNIFANGYITEDRDFIVNWEAKKDFANVGKILTCDVPESRNKLVFRPVRSLVYMLYDKIFGIKPFGYHLHSILVHLVVTTLVYLITFMLIRSYSLSIRTNSYQSRISTNEKQILTNERMFSLL